MSDLDSNPSSADSSRAHDDAPGSPTAAPASATRLLMVEDDERLAELTARYLEQHGVEVSVVGDGDAAVSEALSGPYDVILLDLMLPGRDGVEVCRDLRAHLDVPIIMVTARSEEADRVLGLELGADDYVSKPFSSRELLARVRAQVRRARGRAGPRSRPVTAGRVTIDPSRLRATLDGEALDLTSFEFSLLRAFVERAGRVLSRDQLLGLVHREADAAFDRSIDGHVSRLRQKLKEDPRRPTLLKTVRGAGYLFTG